MLAMLVSFLALALVVALLAYTVPTINDAIGEVVRQLLVQIKMR
jgi:hypothetical protein